MQLEPNKEKSLVIEVGNRKFARYPIKTKLITPEDKDIAKIVEEFASPHIQAGDIVFISEKTVAITQGRSYPKESIKPIWLATLLSKFVLKTPLGIGLGSPQTMQLAIEEVGIVRILIAAIIGGLGKLVGVRGLFYIIAGPGARSIDGAVPYAIPPYNHYVSKGPAKADEVAEKISQKIGVGVAIVDANDLGVNVLGFYGGVDLPARLRSRRQAQAGKKLVALAIKDNPLGQSDEQTPVGIIREVPLDTTGIRKAEFTDLKKLTDIVSQLHIDMPRFVWTRPDYIKKQIKNGEYFLLEDKGVLVGAVSLRVRYNKMHIETLVIKKEYQLKGFGTQLINFAKTHSLEKGYKKLHAYSFLEYNMENFYKKKGFTQLEHLGYYQSHPYQCFEMTI